MRRDANDAHLVGLHAKPFPYIPPVTPDMGAMYSELIDEQQELIDQNADAAQKKFETALRNVKVSQEWRVASGDPSEVVRRNARYADLVIVGQSNEEADRQATDLPEGVLLSTGRPTIVVPNDPNVKTFARNIMVAWDDGIQATRITISLGVASLPESTPADVDDLLRRADDALYAAKHEGRNRAVAAPATVSRETRG